MFQFLRLSLSSLIIFVFMRLQKKPEEVAWLDVPVDDLLVVQVLQPQQHVTKAFPDHNHCITVMMMVMM